MSYDSIFCLLSLPFEMRVLGTFSTSFVPFFAAILIIDRLQMILQVWTDLSVWLSSHRKWSDVVQGIPVSGCLFLLACCSEGLDATTDATTTTIYKAPFIMMTLLLTKHIQKECHTQAEETQTNETKLQNILKRLKVCDTDFKWTALA